MRPAYGEHGSFGQADQADGERGSDRLRHRTARRMPSPSRRKEPDWATPNARALVAGVRCTNAAVAANWQAPPAPASVTGTGRRASPSS